MSSRVERKAGKGFGAKQARIGKRALARAMNRATTGARSIAAREVAKEAGLKVRDVRSATKITRARFNNLESTIEARGRPLNLIRFRARESKRGGGVRAKAYGRARRYKGMWIGNDRRTVFVRTRRKGRSVRGAFGPGIAKTFLVKVRTRTFQQSFADRITREFRTSYDFLLDKGR